MARNMEKRCSKRDKNTRISRVSCKESLNEPDNCIICFDKVSCRGKLGVCEHWFCFQCIYEWSKNTNTCPVCKKKFRCISKTHLIPGKSPLQKIRVSDVDQRVWNDDDPISVEMMSSSENSSISSETEMDYGFHDESQRRNGYMGSSFIVHGSDSDSDDDLSSLSDTTGTSDDDGWGSSSSSSSSDDWPLRDISSANKIHDKKETKSKRATTVNEISSDDSDNVKPLVTQTSRTSATTRPHRKVNTRKASSQHFEGTAAATRAQSATSRKKKGGREDAPSEAAGTSSTTRRNAQTATTTRRNAQTATTTRRNAQTATTTRRNAQTATTSSTRRNAQTATTSSTRRNAQTATTTTSGSARGWLNVARERASRETERPKLRGRPRKTRNEKPTAQAQRVTTTQRSSRDQSNNAPTNTVQRNQRSQNLPPKTRQRKTRVNTFEIDSENSYQEQKTTSDSDDQPVVPRKTRSVRRLAVLQSPPEASPVRKPKKRRVLRERQNNLFE